MNMHLHHFSCHYGHPCPHCSRSYPFMPVILGIHGLQPCRERRNLGKYMVVGRRVNRPCVWWSCRYCRPVSGNLWEAWIDGHLKCCWSVNVRLLWRITRILALMRCDVGCVRKAEDVQKGLKHWDFESVWRRYEWGWNLMGDYINRGVNYLLILFDPCTDPVSPCIEAMMSGIVAVSQHITWGLKLGSTASSWPEWPRKPTPKITAHKEIVAGHLWWDVIR